VRQLVVDTVLHHALDDGATYRELLVIVLGGENFRLED
jgi:hypothetical protein